MSEFFIDQHTVQICAKNTRSTLSRSCKMFDLEVEDWRVASGWSCSSGLTYWLSGSTEPAESTTSYSTDYNNEALFEAAVENIRRQTDPPCTYRLHLKFTSETVASIRLQQSCERVSYNACLAAERARCAAESARALRFQI